MNLMQWSHQLADKKICLSFFMLFVTLSFFGQQNTFPSNGKVGVGTLNPTARLDVNGKVHIDSSLLVKDSVVIQKSLTIEDRLNVEKAVIFQDNLVVEKNVYIPNIQQIMPMNNGNGNGQGNFNNLYKPLYVDSNGKIIRGNGTLTPIGDTDTDDNPCNEFATRNRWEIGTDKLFTRCPMVNVGINTIAPRVKLDVIGAIHGNKLSIGDINPLNTGDEILTIKGTAKLASFNNNSEEVLSLSNNGDLITKKIVANGDLITKKIIANGKIYIHTGMDRNDPNVQDIFNIWTNTGKIVQVNSNGLMFVREIKLSQTWGDYVFDKKYKLLPLSEVEKFIDKNKHLPNIPNADFIENEGITLNETNRIFIEKIEELTLYLIEQNKELEKLKAKLIIQENELKLINKKLD